VVSRREKRRSGENKGEKYHDDHFLRDGGTLARGNFHVPRAEPAFNATQFTLAMERKWWLAMERKKKKKERTK